MDNIYVLIEHGQEQGEAYLLGWFDSEATAQEAAVKMEWEAYREALKHERFWSGEPLLPPDQAEHKRFWVKPLPRFPYAEVPRGAGVH
ncbi:hypothetical protein [Pseudomonas sp. KNUC1026]|uniref:hypothetical protein n=1 Tax=Pseudomonas sp. KNUC1026 TaxID=2893890 RepID=UPI001F225FAB|nr:hypothetical protein [Pseudomonas sp. KNUC1026]UFH48231.1 hypothetical protein LN139_13710 [Pseudomonas sp. KNUC1026]